MKMIDYKMQGRVALVTGGSAGIGRAAAESFARSGAAVLICDVLSDAGESCAEAIRADGGRAAFQQCDVTNAEQVRAAVKTAVATFGRLDFAFNNAGINLYDGDNGDPAGWDRTIAVNLTGVMTCIREEVPAMLATGGGAIVNTSSINGMVGNPNQPGYVAAKHGVVGLTRQAALKWAAQGVRVNCVCPGVIDTAMIAPVAENPELKAMVSAMTPMQRFGRPEEIGEAVVWLCSDAASFVTGHPMVIDGGALAI